MAPTVMRMPKQPSREIVSEALEARIRMATIIELMVSIDESLEVVMADAAHTKTWPDLAIGLYDRLTGRNAEITYEFDNMSIKIPSGTGPSAMVTSTPSARPSVGGRKARSFQSERTERQAGSNRTRTSRPAADMEKEAPWTRPTRRPASVSLGRTRCLSFGP